MAQSHIANTKLCIKHGACMYQAWSMHVAYVVDDLGS